MSESSSSHTVEDAVAGKPTWLTGVRVEGDQTEVGIGKMKSSAIMTPQKMKMQTPSKDVKADEPKIDLCGSRKSINETGLMEIEVVGEEMGLGGFIGLPKYLNKKASHKTNLKSPGGICRKVIDKRNKKLGKAILACDTAKTLKGIALQIREENDKRKDQQGRGGETCEEHKSNQELARIGDRSGQGL